MVSLGRMGPGRHAVTLALMLSAVIGLTAGCGATPKQVSDGTDAACKLVEAFSGTPAVESICATAPELAALAAAALDARAAAAARDRKADQCKPVPTTTVCVTETELAAGIRSVKAKR